MKPDYTAFTQPVERHQLREFIKSPDFQPDKVTISVGLLTIISGTLAGFFLAILLVFFLKMIVIGVLIYITLLAITVLVAYTILTRLKYTQIKHQYALFRFAAMNNFEYRRTNDVSSHPGAIFGFGNHQANDVLLATPSKELEIGNYAFSTIQDGKTTFFWGYIMIRLDRKLPHMVLDSLRNDRRLLGIKTSDLPQGFKKNQILQLEGDFNSYFTLYAPKGYERDAYYVFSPDLMGLLIDQAADYDLEVVDDYLFIYSPHYFELHDPTVLKRLFAVVNSVDSKIHRQTGRYEDDHVANTPADSVAPSGTRLRTRFKTGALVGMMLFLLLLIAVLAL